jgi:hypothetical protein
MSIGAEEKLVLGKLLLLSLSFFICKIGKKFPPFHKVVGEMHKIK